jgi:hypothetical protein
LLPSLAAVPPNGNLDIWVKDVNRTNLDRDTRS